MQEVFLILSQGITTRIYSPSPTKPPPPLRLIPQNLPLCESFPSPSLHPEVLEGLPLLPALSVSKGLKFFTSFLRQLPKRLKNHSKVI